jgi:parallel beta-helix repeat protein
MKRKLSAAVFLAAVTMLGLAASAGAVDGTIEINQAKVMAAGGFPYSITTSGSYRLTGNLTVSAAKDGIDVLANYLTIDLNGFSILGPGNSVTTVTGINASGSKGVTVENGTANDFGLGVNLGFFGIVRNLHADQNGNGIQVGDNAVVEGCTANNSTAGAGVIGSIGGFGIECATVCTISGNTANGNANDGIVCAGNGCLISGNSASANTNNGIGCQGSACLISGNTIFNNGRGLIALDLTTGYGGNLLDNRNGSNVVGGTSLGNNVCTTSGTTSTC